MCVDKVLISGLWSVTSTSRHGFSEIVLLCLPTDGVTLSVLNDNCLLLRTFYDQCKMDIKISESVISEETLFTHNKCMMVNLA